MKTQEEENLQLAHLAAHECATMALKNDIEFRGRYADVKTNELAYRETYIPVYEFVLGKLSIDDD